MNQRAADQTALNIRDSNLLNSLMSRSEFSRHLRHFPLMRWRRLGVAAIAGMLTISGGCLLPMAIAPLPAHAYISRIDVTLDVQAGEPYNTFLNRANAVARAAIQRSFDRDILTTEVYAIVIGQRQGATVQVLSVQVSRNQWRSRPDTQRWATYYPSARFLLGYGTPARNAPATPATTTRPAPTTPTVQVFPGPQPLVTPPLPTGSTLPPASTVPPTSTTPAPQPQTVPTAVPPVNTSPIPTNPLSPPTSTPLPPAQTPRR